MAILLKYWKLPVQQYVPCERIVLRSNLANIIFEMCQENLRKKPANVKKYIVVYHLFSNNNI